MWRQCLAARHSRRRPGTRAQKAVLASPHEISRGHRYIVAATFDAPSTDIGSDANGSKATVAGVYRLTPLSCLLVDDANVNGCTSLAPFVLAQMSKYFFTASMHLSEWLKGEDGPPELAVETPFKMAHGIDVWDAMHHDSQFNEVFNRRHGVR